ncbi:hypothetical protein GCM10010329_30680 [Streptomyces spiroverticillatus]|uniref:Transaldolase n=1 Tax=Streptomyces finlayi TaxID=67296 RepID=A0A918WW98_9ACTN|nr:hypothetical protein GCM10010329_30680 [Streptomyces spiroverticillatus]GHC89699.1 hypothetical protein GCM10010334_23090 [Streptomyces finlayi]
MYGSPTSDPLGALSAAGVSVWLDDLSRELLAGGTLARLIAEKHVTGVTTNPTIFASALAEGERYDSQVRALAERGTSVDDTVLALTTDDVRSGCQALADVHRRTEGVDGRVSVEVDPRLAEDPDATLVQAQKLWETVGEPNLFVKIPATRAGLAAITAAVARGLSVNVTLIFSLERYREVMDAYLTGLEKALADGHDLAGIHSVASFFVSRVDTEVDKRLEALGTPEALALRGRAAVANALLAHEAFVAVTGSPRWRDLEGAGARPQRPLWASTGVKNPDYPDTLYVGELVVPGTVNTMPGATLDAFADHGCVEAGAPAAERYTRAAAHFTALERAGIDFRDVTDFLERDGLAKFEASWTELGETVERRLRAGARATGTRTRTADAGEQRAKKQPPTPAELLGIYLNDHLAGATSGLELFRRAAGSQARKQAQTPLSELAQQVREDRDSLLRIMADLSVPAERSKVALGWLAEKAGRLKPNGHLFARSPLSDVLELEAMLLGVRGKASCWRTLHARADTDPRLRAEQLDTLLERAQQQSARLEELRLAAAAHALDDRPTP